MDQNLPDADPVRAAVALAVRAPSVHNTQPWSWRFSGQTVELRADESRLLRHTDPEGRDLLVSCGCVLHHCTVAAAALGWAAQIHRLPEPGVLARIVLVPHDTRDGDIALATAIPRRRSDRRRFAARPPLVRDEVFLAKSATDQGAVLRFVDDAPQRSALTAAAVEAHGLHRAAPDYGAELAAWSGRRYAPDGVPAQNAIRATAAPRLRRRHAPRHRRPRRRGTDRAGHGRRRPDRPPPRGRSGQCGAADRDPAEPGLLPGHRTAGAGQHPRRDPRLRPRRRARAPGGRPRRLSPRGGGPAPGDPRRPIGEVLRPPAHPYGAGLPVPAELRGR